MNHPNKAGALALAFGAVEPPTAAAADAASLLPRPGLTRPPSTASTRLTLTLMHHIDRLRVGDTHLEKSGVSHYRFKQC